jgi:ATP-dependent Clp protease protease subunit
LFIIGDFMIKFLILLSIVCSTALAKNEEIVLTEDNSIVFNQQVSAIYSSKKTLEIMKKAKKGNPLFLVLDTPGGSVTAGLAFIDTIKSLKVPVHTVTIFAASMGYQFVQELGTRYITPSGTLMSHRGAVGGLSGQVPGELNSRLSHIQAILSGMSSRAAARVGMDKKAYDDAIINELWISGEDAVNSKHADKLANVTCDKNLTEGTYSEVFNTMFGQVTLVFSKCPLISFPIDFSLGKDVKPEHVNRVKQLFESKKRNVNLTF